MCPRKESRATQVSSMPIRYSSLIHFMQNGSLAHWAKDLQQQINEGLSTKRYGDLPRWYAALESLPQVETDYRALGDTIEIGHAEELTPSQQKQLHHALQELIPWRKGPYCFFGTHIDTEWRSDWKWQRLLPHISSLQDKLVLDVGCGNGYHCWRMREAGAARVIGIDPSPRFVVQFAMAKRYMPEQAVDVLPVGIESVPPKLEAFDAVFSMGVLYHRRSPMDHLLELKDCLKPGGELVLETLVIEGERGQVLMPQGRYAMMNNVWFLPSVPTLIDWLVKCGFDNARCVDVTKTTTDEQRQTEWMRFHSLREFLHPENEQLTAEGHPAPLRAIFIAAK